MIETYYTSCHNLKDDLSPPVSYFPSPTMTSFQSPVFSVPAQPFVLRRHLLFESVSKVTQVQQRSSPAHGGLKHTLINYSVRRTLPTSQWIPNLDRWLHLGWITCSLSSMGRKVDFTSDLWAVLTGVTHINTGLTFLHRFVFRLVL